MNGKMCNNSSGNSVNINMNNFNNVTEIKANIKMSECCSKRIWGQILNCCDIPVQSALIKLLKVQKNKDKTNDYVSIAHTVSDCEGFYQFDICDNDNNNMYKIIVGSTVCGEGAVIDIDEGNCNVCCKGELNTNKITTQ